MAKRSGKNNKIALFGGQKIRRVWDEDKEKWYFSVVDIIATLSNSDNPQVYWRVLKKRLIDEGSGETVTKCNVLKMLAPDGKMRLTDMADTEAMFRIIQSIPSPKAEPFKLWLAQVGYERVEETEDPEKAIQRAMATYLKKGYSKNILTDDITFAWAGLKTKDYKKHKDLKKENLRDNMTNLELVLNMLAETSTTEISKVKKPVTFTDNPRWPSKEALLPATPVKKLKLKLAAS